VSMSNFGHQFGASWLLVNLSPSTLSPFISGISFSISIDRQTPLGSLWSARSASVTILLQELQYK
jgi:hypothetical protein